MNPYSPFKIVHHPEMLDALKLVMQPIPIHIHLVPTNKCNHRCLFCAYRMKGYLSNSEFNCTHEIPSEHIVKLLDTAEGVRAVQLTGGGEPLCHPNISEIISAIISRELDLAIVTNGSLLTDSLINQIADYTTWIRISMDAGTRNTYRTIRSADDFEKVWKMIQKLNKIKGETTVGVGYVICFENYKEIYEAAKRAKDCGVDNFRISAVFTPQGYDYFSGWDHEAEELARQVKLLQDEDFRVFNLFGLRIQDLTFTTQDYDYCGTKDFQTYIGADGYIYTCCTLAYNQQGKIVDLNDFDWNFQEAWGSREKRNLFQRHNPCLHCRFPCMYQEKNQFINYSKEIIFFIF
jgi:MoaA/NifB/PqqE/SkfB family radical SAM enzyme